MEKNSWKCSIILIKSTLSNYLHSAWHCFKAFILTKTQWSRYYVQSILYRSWKGSIEMISTWLLDSCSSRINTGQSDPKASPSIPELCCRDFLVTHIWIQPTQTTHCDKSSTSVPENCNAWFAKAGLSTTLKNFPWRVDEDSSQKGNSCWNATHVEFGDRRPFR